VPGDCATPIAEALKAPAYFVYARSARDASGPTRGWGGQFQLCARDRPFVLDTPASAAICKGDGAVLMPFAAVETDHASSWTVTLTDTANYVSPDDARNAGLARLLNAQGFVAGRNNRDLAGALARFRAGAKLGPIADANALFAALEARARSSSASRGYAICNDGDGAVWAAIGVKAGSGFVSHGWWEIAGGACAQALDATLGHDAVYLYAGKHGNRNLVSGPEDFCIADKPFDITGRDRCAARGLASAGFAPTNTKGLPGFTAHIGNDGLKGQ
jgi:uncharacterized membrane protein